MSSAGACSKVTTSPKRCEAGWRRSWPGLSTSSRTEDGDGWDLPALCAAMGALYGSEISADELQEDYGNALARETLVEDFTEDAQEAYTEKEGELGAELMRELERFVILQVVDTRWREHLENMDYLREGVHLRAMAQKDPLVEYRGEGHQMFEELGRQIREEVVFTLFHAELAPEDAQELQAYQESQAVGMGVSRMSTNPSRALRLSQPRVRARTERSPRCCLR